MLPLTLDLGAGIARYPLAPRKVDIRGPTLWKDRSVRIVQSSKMNLL
jgi:hypothetical protein